MTLKKMSAIIAAYAASMDAAGNSSAGKQLDELAAALKKKGSMDVSMLVKILGAQR